MGRHKKEKPMSKAAKIASMGAIARAEGDIANLVNPETAASLFGPPVDPSKRKRDAAPILDRKTEIALLTSSINAAFKGRALVRSGADITNVFILRRPTTISTLDLALGGGIPAGGLTQIIGRFSSGKSYLANKVMAEVQNNYGDEAALSVNMTEMRYDKFFAKWKCGVRIAMSDAEIATLQQINHQNGHPPFSDQQVAWLKDQAGTFVESVAAVAEQLLEVAVQQVESNLFQVVLIDSFGALLTAAEAEHEDGLEGKHRGGAAMVVTQFMHRLHAALNMPDKYGRPNTTTVIGINQYRDNVTAGPYGNPMKVAGGHALGHGKLVDIHVEQGKKHTIKVGNEFKIIGKEINWEIMKGKAGCHDGPKGTYNFYFGEQGYGFGVDVYTDLLVAGLTTSVIDQAGAWYSYRGERLGQGKESVALALHQNETMLAAIRKDIFKTAGLNFITKENV